MPLENIQTAKDASAAKAMTGLMPRALSSFVFAPALLGVTYAGGTLFNMVIALMCVLMAREWFRIVLSVDSVLSFRKFIPLGFMIPVLLTGYAGPIVGIFSGLLLCLVVFVIKIFRRSYTQTFWLVLGALLISLLGISLAWLRAIDGAGVYIVNGLFIAVWAIDSAAFFAGRILGGAKLAPMISPNKTWSGFIFGVLAGALVFMIFSITNTDQSGLNMHPGFGIAFAGALFAVFAQFGDLIESSLKRKFGVKDSGTLIPGHGGILDRVDSFLITVPVVASLIALFYGVI